MGAGLGAQLITRKYGRDAERESDLYGMQYMVRAGYDPQGAVNLQRTFLKLSENKQQDWITGLFASHPPSQERLQNNIALLATLPRGGELGVERYRARIAHLTRTIPAYKAYDEGRKALAKDDFASAGRLAQQAIALEPKEAHFYALMGDVEQKNRQLKAAVVQYDKATRLNPDFFYYYLQRGKVKEQLNLAAQAQSDLERSVALLPTADAYNSLGNLAQKAGRLNDAKAYYAKVAGNQGEQGQQAYAALVDLDLQDNPGKYVSVRAGQDAQGRIVAQVSNPTPRHISGIVLSMQFQNETGQVQKLQRNLRGTVASGSQQLFDLGLTGKLTPAQLKTLQVRIGGAEVAR
jgi:predicted Zn-dependent protease